MVLHLRKRTGPLPERDGRFREFRCAKQRFVERLYLRCLRVVGGQRASAAYYQSGILTIRLSEEDFPELRNRERLPANSSQRKRDRKSTRLNSSHANSSY